MHIQLANLILVFGYYVGCYLLVLSPPGNKQCFCFQNKIKHFLGTPIQIFLKIMKVSILRRDLTDISAVKEALARGSGYQSIAHLP